MKENKIKKEKIMRKSKQIAELKFDNETYAKALKKLTVELRESQDRRVELRKEIERLEYVERRNERLQKDLEITLDKKHTLKRQVAELENAVDRQEGIIIKAEREKRLKETPLVELNLLELREICKENGIAIMDLTSPAMAVASRELLPFLSKAELVEAIIKHKTILMLKKEVKLSDE